MSKLRFTCLQRDPRRAAPEPSPEDLPPANDRLWWSTGS